MECLANNHKYKLLVGELDRKRLESPNANHQLESKSPSLISLDFNNAHNGNILNEKDSNVSRLHLRSLIVNKNVHPLGRPAMLAKDKKKTCCDLFDQKLLNLANNQLKHLDAL